ncbi:hypothetical protein TEP_15050 [Stenotrophomonas sp. TEPEL]|uniref:hypothetical protein n=1 Tax=Stenotrophomonas sp. TEPEL TaxID=2283801 RepID=UPI0010466F9F|nr:hypothetical protein [Stenotrophomonas sp. TEPEL]TDB34846.1 hypothetical protein TEP_15050 [Stenotrophomonas sp. TEPEL]
MTQKQISHPEGLPNCAAGHRARHIHDERRASAGGGHLVECCCRSTRKHPDADAALRDWRRLNQPVRSARTAPAPTASDNVLQFNLGLAEPAGRRTRARANVQGGCP